ncbi:MAG TPA: glycosyl transferase family 1 [Bacteroidetes bacterium]|nr:glycosyl transferase family 1 [Bacteroidota bacterium]
MFIVNLYYLSKKKIAVIGPAYPYRGGNALFVSYLFDVLKSDFDVKIFNYKLLYPSILFPGTTQQDKSNYVIKKADSERIINSINPFNWFKSAKKIDEFNPDLIIFDWWNPFFGPSHFVISNNLKKKYKNKILFITENVISHEGRFVDKFLTKLGIKNADKFLVLSDTVEKSLKEYSGNKKIYKSSLPVYDCYNTGDIEDITKLKSELGFSQSDRIILFFGYVRKYKGLNILLDAMPELIKYDKNIKLLIVGEFYDNADKYYKQIDDLKINDNVKVIQKFVPNEDVGIYYNVSELVVLPYLEATQSGVLNIAYGFNKPVVVTDVGGLSEDVDEGKTGFVVKSGDVKSLVEGIIKYFKSFDSVNFKDNISLKVKDNEFNKLPVLMKEILN